TAGFVGEALKKVESKSFQPTNNVARQRRRTWDECNAIDTKPCALQPRGVVVGCRKIPRNASFAVKPPAVQCFDQSSSDFVNATVASTFCNKAPTRFQSTIHSSQHRIGALDPVQHSVAEHGIEFLFVLQLFGVDRECVQAELPCSLDLRNA